MSEQRNRDRDATTAYRSEFKHAVQLDVSVIIVNYNTRELLRQCLESLANETTACAREVIVVDNASGDGSVAMVRERFPGVILIASDKNMGFSRGNNVGIREARGKYLFLLNSDTILLAGAIDRLKEYLDQHNEASAAGPMLLNEDRTIQRSWYDFPSVFKTFSHIVGISHLAYRLAETAFFRRIFSVRDKRPAFMVQDVQNPMQVDYLVLAALLVRRRIFEEIGLLDEHLFFYHEDCEWGYRTGKAHHRTFLVPDARIITLGGSSSSKHIFMAYRENFRGLLYVVNKHEGAARAFLLRLTILAGMTVRMLLWPLGAFRRIEIGIYAKSSATATFRQDPWMVFRTYAAIARDAVVR